MCALYFSTHFNIKKEKDEDWFDTLLDKDIKLFIDPFLVKNSNNELLKNSYINSFIDFFQKIFEIMARDRRRSFSKYELALSFPEVSNLCLGYSLKPENGAGSGKGYAKHWYEAIENYFRVLKKEGIDFLGIEIISLLVKGIGADRLSDLTANLIKKELIKYTQSICNKHSIPMEKVRVPYYEFDFLSLTWEDALINLPVNPNNDEGIILVPEDILRIDPTLTLRNFKRFLYTHNNGVLRKRFGFKLMKDLDNKKLFNIIRQSPETYNDFYNFAEKNYSKDPYDFKKDPDFIHSKFKIEDKLINDFKKYEKTVINDDSEFIDFVKDLCLQFKHSIEEEFLVKALWINNSRPREEKIVQALFQSAVKNSCINSDVDVSPETNKGRGPVDFKFSRGNSLKVLVELKLIKSSSLLQNSRKQVVQYLKSEISKNAIFLTISYFESDLLEIIKVNKIIEELNEELKINILHLNIDARNNKLSASKQK